MNFTHEIATFVAGGVAGGIGALLGLGGGVILVPFLNVVMGLPFQVASGISLVTIIATSSASSAVKGRMQLVNLRMRMVLEIFTTTGGLIGLKWFGKHGKDVARYLAIDEPVVLELDGKAYEF